MFLLLYNFIIIYLYDYMLPIILLYHVTMIIYGFVKITQADNQAFYVPGKYSISLQTLTIPNSRRIAKIKNRKLYTHNH